MGRMNQDQRCLTIPQDAVGGAAHRPPSDSSFTMGRHNGQRAVGVGAVHNALRRAAGEHELDNMAVPAGQTPIELIADRIQIPFGLLHAFLCDLPPGAE